jgi:hypothetical protein
MSFRTIVCPDLDRLLPDDPAGEKLVNEGIEWLSNPTGDLLGTITNNDSLTGWRYAILKQDTKGDFRVRKVINSFHSLKDARAELLLSMAEFEMIAEASRTAADLKRTASASENDCSA